MLQNCYISTIKLIGYISVLLISFQGLTQSLTEAQKLNMKLAQLPSISFVIGDTALISTYIQLGDFYQLSNLDSAFFYHELAKNNIQKIKKHPTYEKFSAQEKEIISEKEIQVITQIGWDFYTKGNYPEALNSYKKGLDLCSSIVLNKKNRKIFLNLKASLLSNSGVTYLGLGNYPKALDYDFSALQINEKTANKKSQAINLGNIGIVYFNQGENKKALTYFFRALEFNNSLNNLSGQSNNLDCIGLIYHVNGEYRKAEEYYTKALTITRKLGNKRTLSINLSNTGALFFQMAANEKNKDLKNSYHKKALAYYLQALQVSKEISDKRSEAISYTNIGELFSEMKNFKEAEKYLKWSIEISKTIRARDLLPNSYQYLSDLYVKTNQTQLAFDNYKFYIAYKDSIFNEKNTKESMAREIQFNYDKKAAADSAVFQKQKQLREKEIAVQKAEIKAKKNQQYGLFGGIFLLVILIVFGVNRYRKISIQNEIIAKQKKLVEHKNKEITDSINYAKRIQSAILPPDKMINDYLKQCYVLYKPKDVVAGDFYWLEQKNGKVLLAAADCTGHGVPGAMVSVVCNNALNRSVREHGLTDPGQILDKTREIVIQEFDKSEEGVKDGMDIALCSIAGLTLQYAGANNPLWIIRNGEIIETKANKQPIGQFDNPEPYTTHQFELKANDSIYLFSDGYVDQFGGNTGKKFKAKAFRELLLSVQDKTMEAQKKSIDEAFEAWKGNLEQIDDVLVIGFKV